MKTGIVVIGRNEEAHLRAALASAVATGLTVVYVDSASSDASVPIARESGVALVELDPTTPLSAARARNEGLARLKTIMPVEAVMFLDGDCALDIGFPAMAEHALSADPRTAIAVGHLAERSDATSVFSRLSAVEWSSVAGEIRDFGNLGGIMLARVAALDNVGGFDPTIIAGEDSELGVRLSLAGWRVMKIDAPMASHDNGITGFAAWWRRAVRAGHAIAQRYAANGRSALRDCRREFLSTLLWGGMLPLAILLLLVPSRGASLLLLGLYAVIGYRMYDGARRACQPAKTAVQVAAFGLLAKFANMQGMVHYARNRWRGSYRIIEYKNPGGTASA